MKYLFLFILPLTLYIFTRLQKLPEITSLSTLSSPPRPPRPRGGRIPDSERAAARLSAPAVQGESLARGSEGALSIDRT